MRSLPHRFSSLFESTSPSPGLAVAPDQDPEALGQDGSASPRSFAWTGVVGSAEARHARFACVTGRTLPDEDYELSEATGQ